MAEFLTGLKRTKMCGEFRASDIGKEITAMGFVAKYRNLGSLLFIDLRDRTGILQLAFDSQIDQALFDKSTTVRNEYVLAIVGTVRSRGEKNINENLPTGAVEVLVKELRIISEAEITPFVIVDDSNAGEQLRLKYRYLDLRRASLQKNLIMRDKIAQSARNYLSKKGFLEIETPFLGKSTPEGARDYLVPSRIHQGQFYALPQSPQLYKQLLMIAGMDRYFQIARCFRDEDLRANRQPEFSQIDLEMSYVDSEEDVMNIAEGLIKSVFKDCLNLAFKGKFRRMKWKDAMRDYGSDKPDTRFDLKLVDISAELKKSTFAMFKEGIGKGRSIRAINLKGLANSFTRKEIEAFSDITRDFGAKGLLWASLKADGISSSFIKHLSEDEKTALFNKTNAQTGDIIVIVADKNKVVFDSLGALRLFVAKQKGLIDESKYDILWVTEFPLYEYNEEEHRLEAMHHPFTSPKNEDLKYLDKNPLRVRAKAYDLVINGQEAGGGSVRIHSREIQKKMFEIIGLSDKDINERFGFFVEAFSYGVPPHGGLAFGLDRLVMLITGTDNIKDVIAFPKVQNASCLMSDAPAEVEPKQLRDLGIKF